MSALGMGPNHTHTHTVRTLGVDGNESVDERAFAHVGATDHVDVPLLAQLLYFLSSRGGDEHLITSRTVGLGWCGRACMYPRQRVHALAGLGRDQMHGPDVLEAHLRRQPLEPDLNPLRLRSDRQQIQLRTITPLIYK